MPFAPTLSEQPNLSELRTHMSEAADYVVGLHRTPEDQRGESYADDLRSAVDFINEFDAVITAMERAETPPARGGVATEARVGESDERRTLGERVTAHETYGAFRGQFEQSHASIRLDGSIHEARTLLGGGTVAVTIGDDGGAWRPLGTPLPPVVRQQRLFIRDVLNVIPTTLGAVPYVQELNPTVNETGATAVQEGNAKPEVTMEFNPALAPIVTIAAWIPVTNQILEDAPTLQGYVNTRLGYMVALREEAEILNGGGGVNISGILNDPNIQTQNVVSSDFPGTIGLAIGKIENADGDASFVAANPLDYWVAVTTRHSTQFDNGFGGDAPAVLSQITWGTTAIRSRAMASGTALVGSGMGASILDRMETVIKLGNQHSTFFTENKVAVLAEERVGLALHVPQWFVKATVPTS